MHVLRAVVRRAGAAELLVQLALRRLPDVRRARQQARGGRGARGARYHALHQRRRARAVGQQHARVLVPRPRRGRRRPRLLARHALAEAAQARAGRRALRIGRRGVRPLQEPVRAAADVLHHLRRCAPQHRAALQGDGLGRLAREARAVHARGAVPGLQGRPAPPRDAGGHGGRAPHLRADEPVDPQDAVLPGVGGALGAGADDRRAAAEGDPRAARVPRRRRSRLPHAVAARGHARRRRGAADPAGHPDRLGSRRRPLHPRRAVDRSPPARQPPVARHPDPPPRPREHADRRRARRSHDHRGRPHRGHRSAGGGARRAHRVLGRPEGPARARKSRSPARTCPGGGRSRRPPRAARPSGGSGSKG